MVEKLIARVIVDEMKLAKFKKNTVELSKQMKEKEKEIKLNSNKDLFDLNIMKYFYLNMARSINVSEVSYINLFKSEAELKRRFQYQFNLPSPSTQWIKISLSLIVYEHEYTEAEARDMLWRMKHSWMDEMDLTEL